MSDFQALVESNRRLNETVEKKVEEIDRRVETAESEFESWKGTVKALDISGEGRYVTEIFVDGDKDTFYPVYFTMPSSEESVIQIYRHYSWDRDTSDFNASHVASALVVLRGQTQPWDGDANYLRTIVNFQRYRQCVAKVGFSGWCDAEKNDPNGPDNSYNTPGISYRSQRKSGFMLRGGKLKYRIYSNKPISFRIYDEGEILDAQGGTLNYKWIAKTVALVDAEAGDNNNNHGTTYIGYDHPESVTPEPEVSQSEASQ
ncbi:hypothetical protein ACP6H7_25160 [Vibrio harveyi]|uniref:hypothetical protein n=1 Tax=Vibrio harveyi TaxID=669 RepID=UPI003CF4378A